MAHGNHRHQTAHGRGNRARGLVVHRDPGAGIGRLPRAIARRSAHHRRTGASLRRARADAAPPAPRGCPDRPGAQPALGPVRTHHRGPGTGDGQGIAGPEVQRGPRDLGRFRRTDGNGQDRRRALRPPERQHLRIPGRQARAFRLVRRVHGGRVRADRCQPGRPADRGRQFPRYGNSGRRRRREGDVHRRHPPRRSPRARRNPRSCARRLGGRGLPGRPWGGRPVRVRCGRLFRGCAAGRRHLPALACPAQLERRVGHGYSAHHPCRYPGPRPPAHRRTVAA